MTTTHSISSLGDAQFLQDPSSYWKKYNIVVNGNKIQVTSVSDTLFARIVRIVSCIFSYFGLIELSPYQPLLSRFELQQKLIEYFTPEMIEGGVGCQLNVSRQRKEKECLIQQIAACKSQLYSAKLFAELAGLEKTQKDLGSSVDALLNTNTTMRNAVAALNQQKQDLTEKVQLREAASELDGAISTLLLKEARLANQELKLTIDVNQLQKEISQIEAQLTTTRFSLAKNKARLSSCPIDLGYICQTNQWDATNVQSLVDAVKEMLTLKASGNMQWARKLLEIKKSAKQLYYYTACIIACADLLHAEIPNCFSTIGSLVGQNLLNDLSFSNLSNEGREFLKTYGITVEGDAQSVTLSSQELENITFGVLIDKRKEDSVNQRFKLDYNNENPPFRFKRAGLLVWHFQSCRPSKVAPEELWSLGTLLSQISGKNPWKDPKQFSTEELAQFNTNGWSIEGRESLSKVSALCDRLETFTNKLREFFATLSDSAISFTVTTGRKDLGDILKSHFALYQAIQKAQNNNDIVSIQNWIRTEQIKRQNKINSAKPGEAKQKEEAKKTKEDQAYNEICRKDLSLEKQIEKANAYLLQLLKGENLFGLSNSYLSEVFFAYAQQGRLPNLPMFNSANVEVRVREGEDQDQVQILEKALNDSYAQLGLMALTNQPKTCMKRLNDNRQYIGFGTNISGQEVELLLGKFASIAYVGDRQGLSLNQAYRVRALDLSLSQFCGFGNLIFSDTVKPHLDYQNFVNALAEHALALQSQQEDPLVIPITSSVETVVSYIRHGLQPTVKIFDQPTPLPLDRSLCLMLGIKPKSDQEIKTLLNMDATSLLSKLDNYRAEAYKLFRSDHAFTPHAGHWEHNRFTTGGGAPICPIRKDKLKRLGDLDNLFAIFYRAFCVAPGSKDFISLDSNDFRLLFSIIAGALEETKYFQQYVLTDQELLKQWQQNILKVVFPSAINQIYSMESSGYQSLDALEHNEINGRGFARKAVTFGLLPILSALTNSLSFAQLSPGVGAFLGIAHPFGACLKGFAGHVTEAGKLFFGELFPEAFFSLEQQQNISISTIARGLEEGVKRQNQEYFNGYCSADYSQSFDTFTRVLYSSGQLPVLQNNPNQYDRVARSAAVSLLDQMQRYDQQEFSLRLFAALFLPTYNTLRKCFDSEGNFAEPLQELGCTPQEIQGYQGKEEAAQIHILTELPWLVLRKLIKLGALVPIKTEKQTFVGKSIEPQYNASGELVAIAGADLSKYRKYDVSGLLAQFLSEKFSPQQ